MKRKYFDIKDVCYNEDCVYNDKCFCTFKTLKRTCIHKITKSGYESTIDTLKCALDAKDEHIKELNAKIAELENITPFGHLMIYIKALEQLDTPLPHELQKIFKGFKFEDEIQSLNDRWDALKDWLMNYEMEVCKHVNTTKCPGALSITTRMVKDKITELEKEMDDAKNNS